MFYHNILHDDMRNGDGLRVTLFVSGCHHHCDECQNPQTWDCKSGIEFDVDASQEIFEQLNQDYIDGITFSGGDPLDINNAITVSELVEVIKKVYQTKTIWLYTGYTWEDIKTLMSTHYIAPCKDSEWTNAIGKIINNIDILVDGRYEKDLADVNYPWAGSTNQKVIDVQKSLTANQVVLWEGSIT